MKNILFLILSILTLNISAQDVEMLNLINIYRKVNYKSSFLYSIELSKFSKNQVKVILEQNSLSHSGTTNEVATIGISLPNTKQEMGSFVLFLKDYLNVIYKEPKTESETITLLKQYIIYKFHCSKTHKDILLGEYTYIGFHVELSKIVYKPNYVVINGKIVTFKNTISHYKGNYYAVLNFKK